ncbi:hypothetical protein Q7468_10855 [Glaesserella parasuis]|uniref:hypothetical protein n=1 Tax=Glaesserella parasuis TaxID=738 RepID=UPI0024363840|nr:hypothetical protein [Glaesserella parasuis]MDG6304312.1 hypothetical protein [Glaesserella parasuis]MDG6833342.1 hypothetical protein [Glaesserella parasuis]MDO9959439.1 hypothetical protein [Glaesserella parasuis]MDP0095257.1 hypothetical protein [Glaesserella parasuis]
MSQLQVQVFIVITINSFFLYWSAFVGRCKEKSYPALDIYAIVILTSKIYGIPL